MLKKLMIGVFASAIAGGVVFAEGGRGSDHRHSFAELDANGDGFIRADEFEAAKDAKFAEIDTDGNGEITDDEMVAAMTVRHNGEAPDEEHLARFARVFAAMDKDGSGGLSLDEGLGKRLDPAAIIARGDEDGDGQLSEAEFDALKMNRSHHGKGEHDCGRDGKVKGDHYGRGGNPPPAPSK